MFAATSVILAIFIFFLFSPQFYPRLSCLFADADDTGVSDGRQLKTVESVVQGKHDRSTASTADDEGMTCCMLSISSLYLHFEQLFAFSYG